MSDALVDQIFKALRLVPEFDGNSNVLTRFVNLCDQLVRTYVKREAGYELSNLSLINGILNKITGPAARTINSNGIPESWDAIRRTLINNFADHRDETSLYNDLLVMSQGSRTPQEFYEMCQNHFSMIMTYISLHETEATTIESKRKLYKKLTLKSYLRGLRDPLGSRIRCMRPDTIEQALELVHDEMNTLYLQQMNEHLPDRRLQQSTSSFNQPNKLSYSLPQPVALSQQPRSFNFVPQKPFNMSGPSRPFNMPGPSRPYMTQPQRPMQIWKPQTPLHSGPTRTQQMFAAPPPNYRNQSNVFKLPQNNSQSAGYTPRPMSGVSHFVSKPMPLRGHDWTRSGNPPPSNYFKSREMNFNMCDDYPYTYDYDSYFNVETYPENYQLDYYGQPDTYYDYNSDQFQQQPADYNYPSNVSVIEEPQENASSNDEDFQKICKSDTRK